MQPEFIVSVDVGTTKVAAVVGEWVDGKMRIIGAASKPSSGVRKGMVVDMEEAADCLLAALQQAEKMAGVEIDGVCAGISGPHIKSINSRGVLLLPDERREITADDVEKVKERAGNITLPADMEILHSERQDFMVDKQKGIRDPVGMTASRLAVEVHLVTAQASYVENFRKIFEKTGLEVMNLVFQPLACSRAVLTPGEMSSGCLVIDIGGGITDYALFHGGCVRSSGVIPVGGDNITKDLAIGLRIPESVAEEVKLSHGLALESLAGEDEVVLVPGEQENGGREIRKKIIAAIIEPRCEEIFSMIKSTLATDRYMGVMGGGIVLTGGGSMIMGMKSVAGQVFDLPVRKGTPGQLAGLSEVVGGASWSASVGLLFYESERILEEEEASSGKGNLRWMLDSIRKIASLF